MSSMKEHLAGFHGKEAEHHASKAAHHTALAGHFGHLAKCMAKTTTIEATKDSQGILEALAAEHTEQSQQHAGMAEYHEACAEECSKAMDSADLNKLSPLPDGLSVVAPDRPNIRAVPRAGQPEIRMAVAPEFSKMLGLSEEDMHQDEATLRK
jgi:hypothetical protein